jgi:hypothetical protein
MKLLLSSDTRESDPHHRVLFSSARETLIRGYKKIKKKNEEKRMNHHKKNLDFNLCLVNDILSHFSIYFPKNPSLNLPNVSPFSVQSNSTIRSTSSSSPFDCDYDVFLSFRGEDTRKNFTDHLYYALMKVGIRTFRDDDELQRGENISTELCNAIRGSMISIVVFSEGYASSRWCLDELVEIMRCRNIRGQTLFPIFYHVDPKDVRHQIGTFAETFTRHEKRFQTDMERVRRWRAALTEAVSCSGWDLNNDANGYYDMDSCTFVMHFFLFFLFFYISDKSLLKKKKKINLTKPHKCIKEISV